MSRLRECDEESRPDSATVTDAGRSTSAYAGSAEARGSPLSRLQRDSSEDPATRLWGLDMQLIEIGAGGSSPLICTSVTMQRLGTPIFHQRRGAMPSAACIFVSIMSSSSLRVTLSSRTSLDGRRACGLQPLVGRGDGSGVWPSQSTESRSSRLADYRRLGRGQADPFHSQAAAGARASCCSISA